MYTFKIIKKCIRCYSCTRMAEDNFRMTEESAEIYKQPQIDYELEECLEAMKACPIQAISRIAPEK